MQQREGSCTFFLIYHTSQKLSGMFGLVVVGKGKLYDKLVKPCLHWKDYSV